MPSSAMKLNFISYTAPGTSASLTSTQTVAQFHQLYCTRHLSFTHFYTNSGEVKEFVSFRKGTRMEGRTSLSTKIVLAITAKA